MNSLGLRDLSFANLWSSINEEQENAIYTEFALDMTMMTIILIVLGLCIHYEPVGCGIPVREWLMTFSVVYFTRSLFQVIKI